MPARPSIANVIRIEVLWTQGGIPAANVLHLGYSSDPPAAADLAALAHQVIEELKSGLQAYYTDDTTCTEVICTDLSSDSANVGSDSTAWTGTSEGVPVSAGSAFMVNWQQTRRYRGGKPRTYWPGFPANDLQTPSTWAVGAIGYMTAAITLFLANVQAFTHGSLVCTVLGCVSYVNGGEARVAPVWEPFTGFAVSGLIRTQRRRITASSF